MKASPDSTAPGLFWHHSALHIWKFQITVTAVSRGVVGACVPVCIFFFFFFFFLFFFFFFFFLLLLVLVFMAVAGAVVVTFVASVSVSLSLLPLLFFFLLLLFLLFLLHCLLCFLLVLLIMRFLRFLSFLLLHFSKLVSIRSTENFAAWPTSPFFLSSSLEWQHWTCEAWCSNSMLQVEWVHRFNRSTNMLLNCGWSRKIQDVSWKELWTTDINRQLSTAPTRMVS